MSKKQTTPEQFKAMVEFMVQHAGVGRGDTDLRPEDQNDLWDKIGRKLNSIGPPIREVPSWKKVWRDYKSNTKKKLVVNKQQIEGTGGGPNKLITLSDLEEAVSTLLNFKKSVGGIPNVLTFGVGNVTSSPTDTIILDSIEAIEDVEYEPKQIILEKIHSESGTCLLQKQINIQQQFYDDYRSLKKEEIGYLQSIAEQLKTIANRK